MNPTSPAVMIAAYIAGMLNTICMSIILLPMPNVVPTTRLCGEVRFLPEDLITNIQITFYRDKTFLILWNKNPLAFLIHNAEIVSGFKGYFDSLWKRADAKNK